MKFDRVNVSRSFIDFQALWQSSMVGMLKGCTGMKDKQDLIGPLAYWLASGKLDARSVLPAVEKLAAGSPKSLAAILEALEAL